MPARRDRGASATEYAVAAAALAAVITAVALLLGQHVYRLYDTPCDGTPAAASAHCD